ncbi:hypothetical protein, conserved [Plasmodium ovale]|uniref:Uncharacterized protein n=2 Tax=Plasmodium ovale TaxID=36330 RepID=A0A1C3KGA4_PLAOA|nr:hypothetical protein, conserved [Plasmodium ovale]
MQFENPLAMLMSGGGTQDNSLESTDELGNASLLESPMEFFKQRISCVFSSGNPKCIQMTFILLSLIGTLLSLIGAIFSYIYRCCMCCMCCRRSPRSKPNNEASNKNQQLELMTMQMQMQQQQMCNALMNAAIMQQDKINKKNKKGGGKRKKKNSSNGTKKRQSKNSKDKKLHIGYHKN